MANIPIKKFKAGNMETAIWLNKKKGSDGEEIEFKTASLTRSWKKYGENIWRHDAINLRRNDIQRAILVLQKAQEELLLAEKEEEQDE